MKKFLVFLALLMSVTFAQAQQVEIDFTCKGIDDGPIGNQMPRGPVDSPTVYLENYTLTFEVNHPEYVLYIKDEYETVVYSTVVTSATTEVVLPSTLSGDYEIDLIWGSWCFWGYIEL